MVQNGNRSGAGRLVCGRISRAHSRCTSRGMRRLPSFLLLSLAVAACGSKSPSSPSDARSSSVLQGQTLNAVDGTATPRVQVHLSGKAPVTADGDGRFSIDVGEPGAFVTTVRGNGVVERQTMVA